MQIKKEEKFLEGVWFGKLFKGLYLISHNLPSITNMFHYNLHSSGVKLSLLSWLPPCPPPTPQEHPFLPLSPHATCTKTQGEIKTPTLDGCVLPQCIKTPHL